MNEVMWGDEYPKIDLYDATYQLIDSWQFSAADNIKFDFSHPRVIDSEVETEDGMTRQKIRGYQMYVDFSIENVQNRHLLMFLRKMWLADIVMLTPHDGVMKNPNDDTYEFWMFVMSDFNPRYLNRLIIGHSIQFTLKSVKLLVAIPQDANVISILKATTMRVDGITSADPLTSLTFFGEKMWYGGWEETEEELSYVAFWESPPYGEEDPRGVW